MKAYAALLRGVSPSNAKMPELARAFCEAGFSDVKTVLSSGNVVFRTRTATTDAIEEKALRAMESTLGHAFGVFVRPVDELRSLLEGDPYAKAEKRAGEKRVVTFLRDVPRPMAPLPIVRGDARIVAVVEREAFSAYVPGSEGPVFMQLIEKTFGKDVTTRTWDTVAKIVKASDGTAASARSR